MTYQEPVAWKVEVNRWILITFATTEPKARWRAVRYFREVHDSRRGYWPSVTVKRASEHDNSYLAHRRYTMAFSEDELS